MKWFVNWFYFKYDQGDDAKASAKQSEIYAAHANDISKLPAAIRLQILINQIKRHESKN